MSFKTARVTLAAAVATSGTITVSYPTGTTAGHYAGTYAHKAYAEGLQSLLSAPTDFTVSFGASNITVTYLGTTSIPANTAVLFEFDMIGRNRPALFTQNLPVPNMSGPLYLREISLGSPIAGAANNISTSAALTAASATGAVLLSYAAALDVPRNIVAGWTTNAVLTVTGRDVYGNVMVERSAGGSATFTGKKAFASVTSVKTSVDITGLTVGTGNVLGIPVLLPQAAMVIGEAQDGAKATAGTIVAGVTTTATATSGDVRGTYTPNATPDAAKAFQLIVAIPDPTNIGVAQYAG